MIISLTPWDLALAALLLLLAAGLTHLLRIGSSRAILIAGTRTVIQLLLIGLVLKAVFADASPVLIGGLALLMLTIAGYEVTARQDRRLAGWWTYAIGSGSLFVSAFSVTVLTLVVIIKAAPWYTPQYAIPLLGMMLGNAMTGVAVAMDRLTQAAWEQRWQIEARLILGQGRSAAIGGIRRQSIRSGIIPIINAMAAAGVVSLPGMMTGQILAGIPPAEAVKYQILIMFLISASTILGTVLAVSAASRRLFDERDRLRLDRLRER